MKNVLIEKLNLAKNLINNAVAYIETNPEMAKSEFDKIKNMVDYIAENFEKLIVKEKEEEEKTEEKVEKVDEEKVEKVDEEKVEKVDEEKVEKVDEEKVEKVDEEKVEKVDEEKVEIKEGLKINYPFEKRYRTTQNFGENPELYKNNGFKGHFGIDYATPWGTPILACDKGVVTRSGFSAGNGNFIELKHEWGISLYCHLKDLPTQNVGAKVEDLETVGFAGNTGLVYSRLPKKTLHRGTHLHFSIKVNEIKNSDYKDWVDPTPYLKN